MVELLQGSIHVESEVNQYTQFIVTLPPLEVTEVMESPRQNAVSKLEQPDNKAEMPQPEMTDSEDRKHSTRHNHPDHR